MTSFTPAEEAALRALVAPQVAPPPPAPAPSRPQMPERDPALDARMATAIDEALAEAARILAAPSKHDRILDRLTVSLPNAKSSLPGKEHVAARVLDVLAGSDAAFDAELTRFLAPTIQSWPLGGDRIAALVTVIRNHERRAAFTAAPAARSKAKP